MRLRPRTGDAEADQESGPRLTRWLVSGLLTGGATRTHEKAKLRKGVPILVSTPGRLLDHLQNTESFNVAKCRWLVLDEADRLMELGFEETLVGILKSLDSRKRLAEMAVSEGILGREVGGWDWERRRRVVLCSATIREDVQKLAGTLLQHPIVIKATTRLGDDVLLDASGETEEGVAGPVEKFTPPSQLSQKYVVVPLKQRLVALVALLRLLLAQPQRGRAGTRIIVFMSCTDSVDFHWRLLGDASMDEDDEQPSSEATKKKPASSGSGSEGDDDAPKADPVAKKSSLLPNTAIYRLHGSLPLPTRMASLKSFSGKDKGKTPVKPNTPASAILFCTSVASRGLDLPLVRAVVQYDLPTEGGATEYVHRVGRTARAGKGGEAWAMVTPSEAEWVPWVEKQMEGVGTEGEDGKAVVAVGASKGLVPVGVEDMLKRGFGGKGRDYEDRATEVQLVFERWVLKDNKVIVPVRLFKSITDRGSLVRTPDWHAKHSSPTCAHMLHTPRTKRTCFTSAISILDILQKHSRCAMLQAPSHLNQSPQKLNRRNTLNANVVTNLTVKTKTKGWPKHVCGKPFACKAECLKRVGC
jgi:ATP-dependent RNA helicase DDX31/DBP7